ncbi:MAG TPA: class I SAM-dependent methyltransferase [Tepidisphaeraceae bacterium]|jgi:2-polyprenyl-3-methyl-5-hydroxy-6-metoxy-1,4-benzoquinol methylase
MPHYRLHRDPRSSHQQIAKLVQSLKLSPILDVGAAQGMLGHLIQGSGLVIDAVEANVEWADAARPYYRNTWASIVEDAPLPNNEYKLVICADVLEHTPNPLGVLKRLREAATADATFVISVPNVAHLAVRTMLLFGYFPKMERGILDKTHLQFFTKDTARGLLNAAGLELKQIRATGIPLDEVWKTGEGKLAYRMLQKAQHLALDIAPRLFGMQWVMVAGAANQDGCDDISADRKTLAADNADGRR